MRVLRLFAVTLLLPACQLRGPVPVNVSQYVCPDGRTPQAGLTEDQRQLRLTLDGRSYTLGRRADSGTYSNGYYSVRRDDLFLHLTIPGTLLPLHCRLQAGSTP